MVKENVNWAGQEYQMEWFDSQDISDLKGITQVYGFLFDGKQRLCVVRPTEKRGWRLPGGGPEEDETWQQTIVREADEEADIKLDERSLEIIGYIKVTPLSDNCEKGVHYLLRVMGKITKVKEQTEDVAEGLINERKFISPEDFLEYCPWGEIGKIQIQKATHKL